MKNKFLLTSLIFLGCITTLHAQNKESLYKVPEKQHIVGFDANNMLAQFVPFNTIASRNSYPALVTRRLWNGSGYRSAIGLEFENRRPFNFSVLNAYLSVGFTNQKPVSEKLMWIRGFDLRLTATDVSSFIGIAPYWGVEYKFTDYFSLSTEATIIVGYDDWFSDVTLSALPPLHIQAHFVIPKKNR